MFRNPVSPRSHVPSDSLTELLHNVTSQLIQGRVAGLRRTWEKSQGCCPGAQLAVKPQGSSSTCTTQQVLCATFCAASNAAQA